MRDDSMQLAGSLPAPMHQQTRLRAGDWVRVRCREEILATLDDQGRLGGMPFMPEMLAACGKTLRVFKRAHKACDTIHWSGLRKLDRTVHLENSRCDGSAHGGCQAACMLFWNEAWLEPMAAPDAAHGAPAPAPAPGQRRTTGCSMERLAAAARRGDDPDKGPRYACQATDFLEASRPLKWWDPRQYLEDLRSGNVGPGTMLRGLFYRVTASAVRRSGDLCRRIGLGDAIPRALMAFYDAVQRILPRGVPYPRRTGSIPAGQPTPHQDIGDLEPGSRMRVKPYREILSTLDERNKTRGLLFDGEMVPFCEKEFSVRALVSQIIDEHTGYMLRFKTPAVMLEGAFCGSTFSDQRMFCPRSIYAYWRPIWLQPVGQPAKQCAGPAAAGCEARRSNTEET